MGRRRNQSPHPVTQTIPPVVPHALMRPSVDPSHPPCPRQIRAKDQTVRPSETSGTDTKISLSFGLWISNWFRYGRENSFSTNAFWPTCVFSLADAYPEFGEPVGRHDHRRHTVAYPCREQAVRLKLILVFPWPGAAGLYWTKLIGRRLVRRCCGQCRSRSCGSALPNRRWFLEEGVCSWA